MTSEQNTLSRFSEEKIAETDSRIELDLGEILSYRNGKSSAKSKGVEGGKYPIYGANGIIGKTDDVLEESPALIVGRVGAYCGNVQRTDGPCWATDNTMVVRPEEVDLDFIYYLLTSMNLNRYRTGTSQPLLTQTTLKDITVQIPPRPEQKRIGKILRTIDEKIDANKNISKISEEIAQTVFKAWFVDFKPYDEFRGSDLGEIPTTFEVGKVKDYGEVVCGGTPSKNEKDNFGGDIPFITVKDIDGIFITDTDETLSQKGARFQKSKELEEGAVGVSCVATVGKTFITKERCHTNQQINSIVSDDYSAYFIYFYMKHASRRLEKTTGSGSTYNYISKGDFSEFEVLLPPKKKVQEFAKKVQPLMEQIETLQVENNHLEQLRDTLLPKLMKGEIRVNS